MDEARYDVVVIGGGVYGCFVAYQIAEKFPGLRIAVLEREDRLFARASGTNQGHTHWGYMYSLDPELAGECARNAMLFERSFAGAVDHEVVSYYGIHRDSQIDAAGYEEFCRAAGLALRRAGGQARRHFGAGVEAVYATPERTFNSGRLRAILAGRMGARAVEVRLRHEVDRVVPEDAGSHAVLLRDGRVIRATTVYNTTFADINPLHTRSGFAPVPVRCEVFLHPLLRLPPEYANLALSVIRGPFVSVVPSTFHSGHLLASGQFRKLASSDAAPPSEHVDAARGREVCAEALETGARYLPVLRDSVVRGHVVGTRAAFVDAATGTASSRVVPLLDFAGISNYHVILGGKVTSVFEAREPAWQGVRAAGYART